MNSAVFSPDGSRVVTASDDNTARLWDAKTGAALATLSGHTGCGEQRGVQPGRHRVVTASDDKTARLWDAKTGAVLATLGHIGCTEREKQTCAYQWLTCMTENKVLFPNNLPLTPSRYRPSDFAVNTTPPSLTDNQR